MRLAAIALLVAGCSSCAPQPTPAPVPSGPPPAPIHADAGDACAMACEAAVILCPHPVMPQAECAARCAEGMRQLTGNTPKCLAGTLLCSDKAGCQ